jgi:predicted MFS family arabinose efflux permease
VAEAFGFTAYGLALGRRRAGRTADPARTSPSPPAPAARQPRILSTREMADRAGGGSVGRQHDGLGVARAVVLVFVPFAAGYFLSYLFRSTNAVIAPQLTRDLGLTASDLGLMTSVYFLTFATVQLPLGVMLDRYGPRRVQAVLLVVAAAGSALFGLADSLLLLAVARGLIGLGVSGCLMASFKAITLWFDERHWPVVNGCVLAVGGLGAVAATTPLEAALHLLDWRGIFHVLAGITVAVSLLILFVVPEKRREGRAVSLLSQIGELRHIYGSLVFWRLAPLTVGASAANLAIQGLWAGPWLRDVAGFGREEVATYLFVLTMGLAVGSVFLGAFAAALERAGLPLLASLGIAVAGFMAFQGAIAFALDPGALWPWIGFGLLSNAATLSFAYLPRAFPRAYAGRATTSMNMLTFGGTFPAQYLIGWVIDLWPATAAGGYEPEAYTWAFGAALAFQALGLLWLMLPLGRRPAT